MHVPYGNNKLVSWSCWGGVEVNDGGTVEEPWWEKYHERMHWSFIINSPLIIRSTALVMSSIPFALSVHMYVPSSDHVTDGITFSMKSSVPLGAQVTIVASPSIEHCSSMLLPMRAYWGDGAMTVSDPIVRKCVEGGRDNVICHYKWNMVNYRVIFVYWLWMTVSTFSPIKYNMQYSTMAYCSSALTV